jgi:spore coat polysaccharide biosynthesis protein SpsF
MPPRVVLIVQARMGSTRLPGKSLMDLAGAPLVGRILERVQRCRRTDEVVLAVPDTPRDRPLLQLGSSYGVSVFAGSEEDVADRYLQAAAVSGADIVVRLPADNPVVEPAEVDRIVEHHVSLGRPGFSSNLVSIHGSGYPDGIGAEVFDVSLLREALQRGADARRREHVHLNFFDYEGEEAVDERWCPVSTVPCPVEFRRPDLVLDVNTREQYEFMRRLYGDLYPPNPNFHITDIIRWYEQEHR